jgi:hypothetical protein
MYPVPDYAHAASRAGRIIEYSLGQYSDLRFYCPLDGGQSPPTDNKRQGTLGINLRSKWIRESHARHFDYFQHTVSQVRFRCRQVHPASKSLHSSSIYDRLNYNIR